MNKIKKILSMVMVLSLMLCCMSVAPIKAHAGGGTSYYPARIGSDNGVNVRDTRGGTKEDPKGDIIDTLEDETFVNIVMYDGVDYDDNWTYIRYEEDGKFKYGWVYCTFVYIETQP